MQFNLAGKTFVVHSNYEKIQPLLKAQREKLIDVCKLNPLLMPVKTVLAGDLLESVVCKRVSQWMSVQATLEDTALAREITFQISKELIRQKVGDKIPLLIQTSKNKMH